MRSRHAPASSVLALFFLAATTRPGDAQSGAWSIQQVTVSPQGFAPATNRRAVLDQCGLRITFDSIYDFAGLNPCGNTQIYFAEKTAAGFSISQFPAQPACPGQQGPGGAGGGSWAQDSQRLVFHSGSGAGGVMVADWSGVSWSFSPIISGPGSNIAPSPSGDGTRFLTESAQIVYLATEVQGSWTVAPITPPSSPSGVPAGRPKEVVLFQDGQRAVMRAAGNMYGANPDLSDELYILSEASGVWQAQQITVSTFPWANQSGFLGGTQATNAHPRVDASGRRIVFVSDRDLIGLNPDENAEIFFADEISGTWVISQFTSTVGGFETAHADPFITPDGKAIAFVSTRNLVGYSNLDLNAEIFVAREQGGGWTIEQVTFTTGGSALACGAPALNEDATRLTYRSTRTIVQQNPYGINEIFFAERTVAASAVPYGPSCGLALGLSALPIIGGPPATLVMAPTSQGAAGLLAVSSRPAQIPLGTGCDFLVDPGAPDFALLPLVATGGTTVQSLAPLQVPCLLGVRLCGQAAFQSPGGPLGGAYTLSNGLEVVIGY